MERLNIRTARLLGLLGMLGLPELLGLLKLGGLEGLDLVQKFVLRGLEWQRDSRFLPTPFEVLYCAAIPGSFQV